MVIFIKKQCYLYACPQSAILNFELDSLIEQDSFIIFTIINTQKISDFQSVQVRRRRITMVVENA